MANETVVSWLNEICRTTIQEVRQLGLFYLDYSCKYLEMIQKNLKVVDVPEEALEEVLDLCKYEWDFLCNSKIEEDDFQKYNRRLEWIELQYYLLSKDKA